MYKIKAFKKANAILGLLKGDFTIIELEEYFEELKNTIKNQLEDNFVYMIDISEFYTSGAEGLDSVDRKMGEIRYKLEKIGMSRMFLVGGSMKTFMAVKQDEKLKDFEILIEFFQTLEDAIDKLSENINN
jgi:hypothetical protein